MGTQEYGTFIISLQVSAFNFSPFFRSVKVLHPDRYNSSVHNPCANRHCSHLCVVIPGGRARCECPDNQQFVDRDQSICDAPSEPSIPEPLICKCRNGGFCRDDPDDSSCQCDEDFSGTFCENEVRRVPTYGASAPAAVVVPVFLVVIVILSAIGLYIYMRKRQNG